MRYLLVMMFALMSVPLSYGHVGAESIGLESLDGRQSLKVKTLPVVGHRGHRIDTAALYREIRTQENYIEDYPAIIREDSDSTSLVFVLDSDPSDDRLWIRLFVLGECRNERITELYVLEQHSFSSYWTLTETACNVAYDSTSKQVELQAVLKSIDYTTSEAIRFPTGEKGLYDPDVDRYMLLECEFKIEEESSNLFPQVFRF